MMSLKISFGLSVLLSMVLLVGLNYIILWSGFYITHIKSRRVFLYQDVSEASE